jgi:hypothetical protein
MEAASPDPLQPLVALAPNLREKTAEAQQALLLVAASLIGTTRTPREIDLLECRARDLLCERRHPRYASVVRETFEPIRIAVAERERRERVARMKAQIASGPPRPEDRDVLNLSAGASLTGRTEQACSILARNARDRIYRQGGALSRLRTDGEHTEIELLTPDALRGEMDRAIRFVAVSVDGVEIRVDPPQPLVKNLYAWPNYSAFRRLRGVTSTPFISPSGRAVTKVGYDQETGVYLANTLDFGTLPDVPTTDDVRDAVALLREPFCDFPFAHEAGLTHVLALILTPIARELIHGPTPIFAVDASRSRTGKGLLVKLVGTILTGAPPPGSSMPSTDEEIRKAILAKLRTGPTIVLIDNISRTVDSGSLAAVITMEVWRDRILGESKEMEVPNRCAWVMTGNNMSYSQENTGRVAWIRLVPQTERPSTRTDFRRTEVEVQAWITANRPVLFRAAMLLVWNWLAQNRPPYTGPRLGGFASWCDVVGGVLEAAGVSDFLGNMEELVAEADAETDEWEHFIGEWWRCFGETPVSTDILLGVPGGADVVASAANRIDADAHRVLGGALKGHRDTLWLLPGEGGEPEHRVWIRRFEDKRGAGKRTPGLRKGWWLQLRRANTAPSAPVPPSCPHQFQFSLEEQRHIHPVGNS